MNQRQPKVIKFVRKEYQASEEINPRGAPRQRPEKQKPVEEHRLRKDLDFYQLDERDGHHQRRLQEHKQQRRKPLILENNQIQVNNQKEDHLELVFDKKLCKLMMPDRLQKVKIVKKIQNRLLSCLDRKKPHIHVKQLINQQALNEILGKRQRKLQLKEGNHNEKLDLVAQSLKKIDHFRRPQIAQFRVHSEEDFNWPLGEVVQDEEYDEDQKQHSCQSFQSHLYNPNFDSQDFQSDDDQNPQPQYQQLIVRKKSSPGQFSFISQPQRNNLFVSKKKPQKEKRQSDRFNLKNLKIPKLNQNIERGHRLYEKPIRQRYRQQFNENDQYSHYDFDSSSQSRRQYSDQTENHCQNTEESSQNRWLQDYSYS